MPAPHPPEFRQCAVALTRSRDKPIAARLMREAGIRGPRMSRLTRLRLTGNPSPSVSSLD